MRVNSREKERNRKKTKKKRAKGYDKGTLAKNEGEDIEIRADEGIERMHTRMRLEGSEKEIDRETWREIRRNRGVWRQREGEIESDKERERERAHEMQTAEERWRERFF